MTNPDALAGVVARVTRELPSESLGIEDWEVKRVSIGDLRTLLAALAEARKDSERLDWLEANPRELYPCPDQDGRWHIDRDGSSGYCSATPRTALDAAEQGGRNG